jgi:hypothetical protein
LEFFDKKIMAEKTIDKTPIIPYTLVK